MALRDDKIVEQAGEGSKDVRDTVDEEVASEEDDVHVVRVEKVYRYVMTIFKDISPLIGR